MRLLTFVAGMMVMVPTGCNKPENVPAARDADEGAGAPAVETKEAPAKAPEIENEDKAPEAAKAEPPTVADTEGDKAETPKETDDAASSLAAAASDAEHAPEPGMPFLFKRDGLHISSLILAKGFEKPADGGKRMPVDPGHAFPCDDRKIFVIVDLENPSKLEGELSVGWIKPGDTKEGNMVSMTLTPNEKWRTFAFNRYPNQFPGVWQVVIRDADNSVLARASFEMQKAE
jgi:hypothetical protein